GDAVIVRSEDGRFEAAFADPKDEILAPYLFAAMADAYEVLGEDLGVRPEDPIRFEFYDEPGKLALVTPLTLDNIYTTGTVGICKYRRIMMISPRVMLYGYGWLDTAVHEYVHYLLTIRTRNNAPVWLQEGTAKLLESRWRVPGPQPLSAPVRKLLHDAIVADELVTLEQMHPSIAMLPSQEMAALAYAEAETMLGLLEEQRGREGMASLMDQVEFGVDAKIAFAGAWGADFEDFFAHWKRTMTVRTKDGGAAGPLSKLAFRGEDDAPGSDPSLQGDVFSHLEGGRARQHARLGVLLTLRGHIEAAVIEYEKARAVDPSVRDDPKLARRLGELYLELDRPEEALPLLILAGEDDPDNANVAAAEARARRLTGDVEGARAALDRALRQNPFIPGIHCDLAALAALEGQQDVATRESALCHDR
ncbi:MAG: tetratricopeptide repeat protein, partial [Myxococcales bacterium]|nr:tetratricopeptide repeat protein [Myxococcales bacterium]